MPEKTPQDYANELLRLYRQSHLSVTEETTLATATAIPTVATPAPIPNIDDGTGGLIVSVTTLRGLYPVASALVTVFTGDRANMQIIEMDTTNESGKSKVFRLDAPARSESLEASENKKPYSTYNVSVRSDGYVEQIAMNVPIFSGVVSMQGFDLTANTAAGQNTSPQIIQGSGNYNL